MHGAQALQGLEVEPLVAHREIVALDQRDAQVARDVGVLEVGLVVGPGRQQHDVRRLAGRAHALEALHHRVVGGGQALHVQRLEGLRELPRNGQPVLQQVAQARGSLGALRHHPPVAVGPAREVEGGDAQPGVARRAHAMHRAQVAGVALHQGGRQQAFCQQLLRPVDVGQDAVEEAHALQRAGLDRGPALGRDDQREEVERPGPLRPAGVGIHVVGDAVVADLALQADGAPGQVAEALGAELLEEAGPVRCQRSAFGGLGFGAHGRGRGRGGGVMQRRRLRGHAEPRRGEGAGVERPRSSSKCPAAAGGASEEARAAGDSSVWASKRDSFRGATMCSLSHRRPESRGLSSYPLRFALWLRESFSGSYFG